MILNTVFVPVTLKYMPFLLSFRIRYNWHIPRYLIDRSTLTWSKRICDSLPFLPWVICLPHSPRQEISPSITLLKPARLLVSSTSLVCPYTCLSCYHHFLSHHRVLPWLLKELIGTSLAVWWLHVHLPMQGMQVWSVVTELRFHMLQGSWACVPQQERSLCATTKTWCRQIH